MTRISDRLVTNIEIHDPMLSDHLAVSCMLQLEKPPLERVEIQYRRIWNINMDSFNEDLRKSNLSNNGELPTIIDQYEKTLKETLQKHAPLGRTNSYYPSAISALVQQRNWQSQKTA